MRKTLSLATVLALLAAVPAEAQSSVSCMYMLMRVYHAELAKCGAPLPVIQENRYVRQIAALEKFIRANAKNDAEALLKNVDGSVQRALAGLKSCNSPDFNSARSACAFLNSWASLFQ